MHVKEIQAKLNELQVVSAETFSLLSLRQEAVNHGTGAVADSFMSWFSGRKKDTRPGMGSGFSKEVYLKNEKLKTEL